MAPRRWVSKQTPTLRGGKTCCESSATSCSAWMKRRSARQDRGEDRSASGLLSTILAQALERAMPEVAFRSDVAVFHVRYKFRLDSRSFSVLTGFVRWRLCGRDRVELPANLNRALAREYGPDLADITQLVALALAEVQGRDAGGSFTKPTIGNFPHCTHLIFSQASLLPGRFRAATFLDPMPSICIAQRFGRRS
jgi:hypothetical protein